MVGGVQSDDNLLRFVVSLESALGPVQFTMFMQPFSFVISKFRLNFHFYADNSRFYDSSHVHDIDR